MEKVSTKNLASRRRSPIPTLLKPTLWSLRNRFRSRKRGLSSVFRDLVILGFLLFVTFAIYRGTLWTLTKANALPEIAYLPPSLPLGLIFLLILAMLFISNLASATSSLFFARDLELILSSPVSRDRYFGGVFLYCLLANSWMSIVLIAPFVVGFGHYFDAPLTYYLYSAVAIIPYFSIPTALALIASTLVVSLVPSKWLKGMLLVVLFGIFYALYLIGDLVGVSMATGNNTSSILRIASVLSLPDVTWLPSHWLGNFMQELLIPTDREPLYFFLLLVCASLSFLCLAYILVDLLHERSHARVQTLKVSDRRTSRDTRARLLKLIGKLNQQFHAIITKDLRMLFREISHSLQLLILLSICIVYLYNLQVLTSIQSLPEETRETWRNILYIMNCAMAAFITTAICTRFVYPALSLEGRAFWLLRTSPISIRDILKAKFRFWYFPIAIISGIIYATGAFAIGVSWVEILGNWILSWLTSYGIVGLAIGLGTYFARFDWEHSSQLAAGFGSLSFMLLSLVLIIINVAPLWVLLFLFQQGAPDGGNSVGLKILVFMLVAALLFILNTAIARVAINKGEEALLKRIS